LTDAFRRRRSPPPRSHYLPDGAFPAIFRYRHSALKTHIEEIGAAIHEFIGKTVA
jgi:hypothetical protein